MESIKENTTNDLEVVSDKKTTSMTTSSERTIIDDIISQVFQDVKEKEGQDTYNKLIKSKERIQKLKKISIMSKARVEHAQEHTFSISEKLNEAEQEYSKLVRATKNPKNKKVKNFKDSKITELSDTIDRLNKSWKEYQKDVKKYFVIARDAENEANRRVRRLTDVLKRHINTVDARKEYTLLTAIDKQKDADNFARRYNSQAISTERKMIEVDFIIKKHAEAVDAIRKYIDSRGSDINNPSASLMASIKKESEFYTFILSETTNKKIEKYICRNKKFMHEVLSTERSESIRHFERRIKSIKIQVEYDRALKLAEFITTPIF